MPARRFCHFPAGGLFRGQFASLCAAKTKEMTIIFRSAEYTPTTLPNPWSVN